MSQHDEQPINLPNPGGMRTFQQAAEEDVLLKLEQRDTGFYKELIEDGRKPFPNPYVVTPLPAIKKQPVLGKGGAPIRATTMPTDAAERKGCPVATGVLDYFPDAIIALSRLSVKGNAQHNLGVQDVFWDRSKSGDEADTMIRHYLERGTPDEDGVSHTVKMAWRALAILQKEMEKL